MDLREYQRKARSTAIYPEQGRNLHYPVLGIVGEWGEFCTKVLEKASKDLIKLELGDILWYVANLACEAWINLEELRYEELDLKEDRVPERVSAIIGNISEVIKKTERDHAGVLSPERTIIIKESLEKLLYYVDYLSRDFGFTLNDATEANINKLFSRKNRNKLHGEGDER